jgi:hypothetical protein
VFDCLRENYLYNEGGFDLSEEAKIAYIQERLKEVRRGERNGSIWGIFGAVLLGVGIGFSSILGQSTWILEACGILLFLLGLVDVAYCGFQRIKLMNQMKTMSISIPKCPKCGKELPKGNFAFCPFCGSSLEKI